MPFCNKSTAALGRRGGKGRARKRQKEKETRRRAQQKMRWPHPHHTHAFPLLPPTPSAPGKRRHRCRCGSYAPHRPRAADRVAQKHAARPPSAPATHFSKRPAPVAALGPRLQGRRRLYRARPPAPAWSPAACPWRPPGPEAAQPARGVEPDRVSVASVCAIAGEGVRVGSASW